MDWVMTMWSSNSWFTSSATRIMKVPVSLYDSTSNLTASHSPSILLRACSMAYSLPATSAIFAITCKETTKRCGFWIAKKNKDAHLDVILQPHLQALGKVEVCLGDDRHTQLVAELFPMATAHTRIPQALDQRYEGPELFDGDLDLSSHLLYARQLIENLHRLVHCLVALCHRFLHRFGIHRDQRIIHDGVVHLQPIGHRKPEIAERLKVLHEFCQFFVLKEKKREIQKFASKEAQNDLLDHLISISLFYLRSSLAFRTDVLGCCKVEHLSALPSAAS